MLICFFPSQVPPNVLGLIHAIESKFSISAKCIRSLNRKTKSGITAVIDDDMLKFYCNEDTFLMQVNMKKYLFTSRHR